MKKTTQKSDSSAPPQRTKREIARNILGISWCMYFVIVLILCVCVYLFITDHNGALPFIGALLAVIVVDYLILRSIIKKLHQGMDQAPLYSPSID